MKLMEVEGEYAVLRYPSEAPWPDWVKDSRFCSVSMSKDELSVVCESRLVRPGFTDHEGGWGCLKVQGPLDFGLTGILSSIAGPLAVAKISIFAISTFDTDYVLVKQKDLVAAKMVLRGVGFEVVDAPK